MRNCILCIMISISVMSCNSTQKDTSKDLSEVAKEQVETPSSKVVLKDSANAIHIDVTQSVVNWRASMLFSFGGHHGTTNFKEGTLQTTGGNITGGTFVVDMQTIANVDGGYSQNLVSHLKNEDFFDVEQYPTATLVMTQVTYINNKQLSITADLTIKNITKPIRFQADLDTIAPQMTAMFIIDRSEWDITYGSKETVSVKDYAISNSVEFKVSLFY